MTLLSANNVGLWFGDREIMSEVNFTVGDKAHIGLVGVNGSGKTTMFKMITGQLATDEGDMIKGRLTTIGYMEQISLRGGMTVYEETLLAFEDLIKEELELASLTARLASDQSSELIERHHRLNEHFVENGGLTYQARTRSALLGLGFTPEQLEQQSDTLSGGQHSKLQLCKLLLSGANLLLLDEPTNHLDISAIEWLENFLATYNGAFIVISHDRYFLDKVTDSTLELENRRVTYYKGNYSRYLELKQEARENAIRQNENTVRQIKHIEGIIEQQRRWNQERNYVTIASKQKHIERLEQNLVEVERTPEKLRFKFDVRETVCNEVLKADRLSKAYSSPIFTDISLLIRKNERVFLIGPNGCGKSTLLKILASQIPGDSGFFSLGPGVVAGYFDQTLSTLHADKTVLNELWDEYPRMNETQIRSALGRFLFHGDDVFKPVSALSGGEKARLALLKLMMTKANLLLLDEPTNNLDIASREALENALLDYEGTMLIVSHDRYLINKLAQRLYHMHGGTITAYEGNYDYFEEKFSRQPQQHIGETSCVKAEPKVNEYKLRKEQQSARRKAATQITKTEARLEQIDELRSQLTESLNDPEFAADYSKVLEATQTLESLDNEESELFEKLEELYAIVEEGQE